MTLLDPTHFSNTYTLAVPQNVADEYGLVNMSDLAKSGSDLMAGTTLEFLNRADGLNGVEKAYGFKFKDAKGIDGATRYVALNSGDVQVIDAFATDGLLKKYNLKVLKDDKHFFPPYYGVPVFRDDVLAKHPELKDIVNKMSAALDEESIRTLNYEVDVEHKSPKEVAHQFLVARGLIKDGR